MNGQKGLIQDNEEIVIQLKHFLILCDYVKFLIIRNLLVLSFKLFSVNSSFIFSLILSKVLVHGKFRLVTTWNGLQLSKFIVFPLHYPCIYYLKMYFSRVIFCNVRLETSSVKIVYYLMSHPLFCCWFVFETFFFVSFVFYLIVLLFCVV